MKRYLHVACILVFMFLTGLMPEALSQPNFGGEITWECTPQGTYRFIAKRYRDCHAVSLSNSITLTSNAPGFSSIVLNRVSVQDISPICVCPGGTTITCSGAPVGQSTGAVEMHTYTSDNAYPNGVALTGVPPSTGWYFAYVSCCRPYGSNITSTPDNFVYKVVMFPYDNSPVDNCFDNSPVFLEPPAPLVCAGISAVLNYMALDIDSDSLVYEWAPLMLQLTSPYSAYAYGYSYMSPFPGTVHDPANVPAVLDQETGIITFKSVTTGAYFHVIKVSSYRNGVKICEVFREYNTLIRNCDTLNNIPVFALPLQGGPGQNPGYSDTVFAGEFVSVYVGATDFEYCPGVSPPTAQNVYLTAISDHFGAPLNPGGCLVPPCAVLNPSPAPSNPVSGQFGVYTDFTWQTDCSHIVESISQNKTERAYSFLFKAWDSFCPAPGVNFAPVTIVVRDLPPVEPPDLITLDVLSNGDALISWKPPADTMNSFKSYQIWTAMSPLGPYTLLDTLAAITDSSYVHIGADLTHHVACYYISVKSGCFGTVERISDTICGTSINAEEAVDNGYSFYAGQNIPNPAQGLTTIPVVLPEAGTISLKISDLTGKTLLNQSFPLNAGENKVEADISRLHAGVYFYSVIYNGLRHTRKMVINL